MAICEINAIKIDMKTDSYISDRKCKQNDTLILNFIVLDYCVAAILTGFKCILKVNKSNIGYEIRDVDITQTDNKVRIKCPSSVTQFAGDLNLELCFIDTVNNLQKTSFDICIEVRKSVLGNADGTLPTAIFTQLQQLDASLNKIEGYIKLAEDETTKLINTTTSANNADLKLNASIENIINTVTESIENANTTIANVSAAKSILDNSTIQAESLIEELQDEKSDINSHMNNMDIHVTKEKQLKWDANELMLQQLLKIVGTLTKGIQMTNENGTVLTFNGQPWTI